MPLIYRLQNPKMHFFSKEKTFPAFSFVDELIPLCFFCYYISVIITYYISVAIMTSTEKSSLVKKLFVKRPRI